MNTAQVVSDASAAQLIGGGAAISCLALAFLAGWRERRRARRDDPDAVGWVDWTAVQMLALIGVAVGLLLVAKGQ